MSAKPPGNPAAPRTAAAGQRGPERLVNPVVRGYMEALNLQRFYGGYQRVELDAQVFNLGIGEVGNIPLPEDLFTVYARFVQEQRPETRATRYTGTMGEEETNRALAAAFNTWLGVERFGEQHVVSVDGGHNGVEVALRAFTSPLGSAQSRKQYALLATPAYPYFASLAAAQAGLQTFLAYDAEQFTRGVEMYCNPGVGVIVVNVPHNPMGYALSAEQVARIDRVAAAHDCAILVDAVYGPYPEDARVGQALAGFDPERTVFVDSLSKRYGLPGMRVGFLVSAAEELVYALRFVKMAESLTPSGVKLAFAGHLLRRYADYPRRIAAEVRQRRARFLNRFDPERVPGVARLGGDDNPFYLVLDIQGLAQRSGLSDSEVRDRCQQHYRVRTYPGAFVYPHAALEHATFHGAGRLNPHGQTPYLPPQVPEGAPVVYAPDAVSGRRALLRLSFGTEGRVGGAAEALQAALAELAGTAPPDG